MKTENINNYLSIILKCTAIICITLLTIISWQKKDIGKFQNVQSEYGQIVINTKTGEKIAINGEDGLLYKITVNPFAKDTNEVYEKILIKK